MTSGHTYTIDEIEELTGFDRRTIAYYVQQGVLPKVGRRGPKTRYPHLFLDRLQFIRMIRELQDQGAMGTMTLGDFRDLFRSVPAETIAEALRSGAEHATVDGAAAIGAPEMASPRDRRRTMARQLEELTRLAVEPPSETPLEARGRPMDPAQDAPAVEPAPAIEARTYRTLADRPPSPAPRDTPPGEHHRLTLDAIERSPDAPEPVRMSGPPRPVEDELRESLVRLHGVVRRQPRAYLRTTETWTRARITEEVVLSARGLEERHLPLLERVAQILRRLIRESDGGSTW